MKGHACITGRSTSDVCVDFRGAFVVVVARELVTDFDTKTDRTDFGTTHDTKSWQSTQESSFGLAPVMAAFIQVLFDFSAFLARKLSLVCRCTAVTATVFSK